MTLSAAAQTLGVSADTLYEWDRRLAVLPRDTAGWRLDPQHLEKLLVVKRLQEQGRSLESIRVILEPPSPDVMASAPVGVRFDRKQHWIRATLRAATEVAAARAEAFGVLARQSKALEARLAELGEQVAELSRENSQLRTSLEAAEDRIQRTELISAVRQAAPTRPRWRPW